MDIANPQRAKANAAGARRKPFPVRDRLQDKHALVIVDDDGASAQIAAQISLRLAMEGCHISALAGDEQLLQQIARDIRDVRGHFDYEVA